MIKKVLKGEKKEEVTLSNLSKIQGIELAPVPDSNQKKIKGIKPFTLNVGESSYNELINVYQTYKLETNLFSLTLTQFYEVVVLFYENYLKANNIYLEVPDYYVKDVLKKTGRRKFRPHTKDEATVSSNIWFGLEVYNSYLNITYSYAMNYDKINAGDYSLSYMCYKLIDFLKLNSKEFNKFKLEKFIK